ncbi:MAG: hypothetical protein M4579_007246 [Chaenotheca gracillima]|nr:MAG: hypothetical protein M4579_007246 [Chaenotheca gracillima]
MPPSTAPVANAAGSSTGNGPDASPGKPSTAPVPNPNFPPPKTDKPRPHICGTCTRSFARLEHLKRHERSHTKEKPFECPECARCFARRDLLLRHQQKLHLTNTTSSRPRNARRESASSTAASGPGRVRKNSVAHAASAPGNAASMRPRANTISHVDGSTLNMLNMAAGPRNPHGPPPGAGHSHHASLQQLPGPGMPFRGMSNATGHHGNPHALPKLDTHHFGGKADFAGSLRTAPAFGQFPNEYELDGLFLGGHAGSTINPAQLHFNDSPQSMALATPSSPYPHAFPGMPPGQPLMEEEDQYDWMNGFENQMTFGNVSEQALDGSSPSAISTASQSGISEVMLDGSNNPVGANEMMWTQGPMMPPTQMMSNPFAMDLSGSGFGDMAPPPGTISPKSLHDQQGAAGDPYFTTPPPLAMSPSSVVPRMPQQFHPPSMSTHPDTPSSSSISVSRHGSVASLSTDSITDATRHALLVCLSQASGFGRGQRKYSAPSPTSPNFASPPTASASLPSTRDIQRYVGAYLQYFHPHLPFLHLPTLSFDPALYANSFRSVSEHAGSHSGVIEGGGCLILSMAAIGAFYEYEPGPSAELFESAKKLIQLYLEERRKAEIATVFGGPKNGAEGGANNTPLWLVQAMLLNVVYGIDCGNKTSGDIANTHCAALVSLARAAGLTSPPTPPQPTPSFHGFQDSTLAGSDVQMGDDGLGSDPWRIDGKVEMGDEQGDWYRWVAVEERKRTLYAVFIVSSMFVSAYNHAPCLTNSEIRLDLPCDEDLWSADNAQAWYAHGGAALSDQNAMSFSGALGNLLSASQRQSQPSRMMHSSAFGLSASELSDSELKPSTFGCLVLINALHNYIWETRQRHHAREWTAQETEAMHAHIEPALKAWQSAWASSNQHHSVERPNPYGKGPLSADSIPLLDLAYVRLFVNLGRTKEAFWQRNYDVMADEFAHGFEIVQHASGTDHPPSSGSSSSDPTDSLVSGQSNSTSPDTATSSPDLNAIKTPTPTHSLPSVPSGTGAAPAPAPAPAASTPAHGQSSKRERHLRKAAFYAADSLLMSAKLGTTFADFNSRELPLSAAMCGFDCAQVVGEWVSTVQERVGRYVGILGLDEIDFNQVPGIMLLEDEDSKLLGKIAEFLEILEAKLGGVGIDDRVGYGAKILRITAAMLDKAAVWPITHLMARSLETQATHMKNRTERSVLQREE